MYNVMNSALATKIKKTGATFTPEPLAEFLASELLAYYNDTDAETVVLDPACGDGVLLSAMCKAMVGKKMKMVGYDTNADYLNRADKSLRALPSITSASLRQDDFLTVCSGHRDLFGGECEGQFADIVIANPPYVRTQVMGAQKAQQLARLYNLSGRIDLYFPFIIAMTNSLKKGGLMGVITSNRYLFTKSGADIRKYLLDNYDILDVIDLGDTKIFDAAVLPAILIGRKKGSRSCACQEPVRFRSIYEGTAQDAGHAVFAIGTIYDLLKRYDTGVYSVNGRCYTIKSGSMKHSANKTDIWKMATEQESDWTDTINSNAAFRVGDRFKVRVGIKSCADNVFIRGLWQKDGYQIESQLLTPMISQENIEAWSIDHDSMLMVLYPHYSANGKRRVYELEKYPVAKAYLESNRETLEKREYLLKSNRLWYEYWVPQDPALWALPKVVFPDISLNPRFCYDESGAVVNGNCYWICARTEKERRLLLLIEGVSNSDVMVKYHDLCFNNKLYSGRRRYFSQYIEQYPMPDPDSHVAQAIIRLVNDINHTADATQRDALVTEVNALVRQAFSLSD